MSENIKALIRSCVEKHKYKPLAPGESEYVRAKYKAELPGFLTDKINGSDMKLFMKASNGCGDLVCNGFDRIVIGDYGAYIEFSESQKSENGFTVIKGQEWRTDERYNNTKYDALTTNSFKHLTLQQGAPLIYKQKKTVEYADYVIGKYYISVYDVFPSAIAGGYAEGDVARVQCIEHRKFYDSLWEIKDKASGIGYIAPITVKRSDIQKADELLHLAEKCLITGTGDLNVLSEKDLYYD